MRFTGRPAGRGDGCGTRYRRCCRRDRWPVVRGPRLLAPAQPAQQLGAGGVERVVPLQRQTVNLCQRDLRAVELGDRDQPFEPHDRRGVEADQLIVERDDLRPVGVTDIAGAGVDRVDRGEDLVAPWRLAGGEARTDQGVALGDQLAVPGAAVLLVESDELTARRHPHSAECPLPRR